MDLSKAFDCISHELLLEKLHAYGFDKTLLTFMHAYLNQRLRKTKLGATLSELMSFLFGHRATFNYNIYLRFVYSHRLP